MNDKGENTFYPSGQAVPVAQVFPGPNNQYFGQFNASPGYYTPGQMPIGFSPVMLNEPPIEKGQNVYIPLQNMDNRTDAATIGKDIKDILTAKDYEVEIWKWFTDAWVLYKQNFPGFLVITIIQLVLCYLSSVGALVAWPMTFGYFIASAHALRSGEPPQFRHMIAQGYMLFFPLLLITLILGACVAAGFLAFIIPGIYLLIAFSFGPLVYIEYRTHKIGLWDSLIVSMKKVNKHFFWMLIFFICKVLLCGSGILLFGVGFLVTYPLSCICMATAFNDIFGVNPDLNEENGCVCC